MNQMLEMISRHLDPPWSHRASSLLTDLEGIHWGKVDEVFDAGFSCLMCDFVPFEGITLPRDQKNAMIESPPVKGLAVGDRIGFMGFKVSNQCFQETAESVLWKISDFQKNAPPHFVHLFSGSFCGWGRACDWLVSKNKVELASTTCVDVDELALRVWNAQWTTNVFFDRVSLRAELAKTQSFCGPIQKHCWMNLCRGSENLILTASPPCQPWSHGGLLTGLHSDNGMTFLELVRCVLICRPVSVIIQDDDNVPQHPHFVVIRAALRFAGFVQAWSAVSDLTHLTGMSRKRWIAIWIRHDVQIHPAVGCFSLKGADGTTWDHPDFNFSLPPSVRDQLRLSDRLLMFYGDPLFLPLGSRRFLPERSSLEQCLKLREILPGQTLPTICDSYTRQHELAMHHMREKGIFAVLVRNEDSWFFLDPVRCLAFLGAHVTTTAAIHWDVSVAFKHLGNAISVQHALLGLLVAFNMCGIFQSPIAELVICAWQDRLKPSNCFVLESERFIWIMPHVCFARDVSLLKLKTKGSELRIISRYAVFLIESCATLDVFLGYMGFSHETRLECRFVSRNEQIHRNTVLTSLIGSSVLLCCCAEPIWSFKIEWNCHIETVASLDVVPATIRDDEEASEHSFEFHLSDIDEAPQRMFCFVTHESPPFFAQIDERNGVEDQIRHHVLHSSCSKDANSIRWFHCHEVVVQVLGLPVVGFSLRSIPVVKVDVAFADSSGHVKIVSVPRIASGESMKQTFGLEEENLFLNGNLFASKRPIMLQEGDFLHSSAPELCGGTSQPCCKKQKIDPAMNARLAVAQSHGLALALDEVAWFASKVSNPAFAICSPFQVKSNPCVGALKNQVVAALNSVPDLRSVARICIPILMDTHWVAVDAANVPGSFVFETAPDQFSTWLPT